MFMAIFEFNQIIDYINNLFPSWVWGWLKVGVGTFVIEMIDLGFLTIIPDGRITVLALGYDAPDIPVLLKCGQFEGV